MGHRFEAYCKNYQDIENYDAAKKDNFKGWCCHHRLETHNSDGKRRDVDISPEELISIGMYFDRPAYELVFLTRNEHKSLHNKGKTYFNGKHHTEEAKKKIGEAQKGNTNTKGMRWYNNGIKNIMSKECPPGFMPGILKK